MSLSFRTLRRHRVTAALAAAALCMLVVLPGEHVHVADDHGDHGSVVHRHFTPHTPAGGAAVRGDHSSEHRAVWTASAFLGSQRVSPGVQPALDSSMVAVNAPAPQHFLVRTPIDDRAVHDPPLTRHGLRAPPA